MNYMFIDCLSLPFIPRFEKWEISPKTQLNGLFSNCISLSYLPLPQNKQEYDAIINDCFQLIKNY